MRVARIALALALASACGKEVGDDDPEMPDAPTGNPGGWSTLIVVALIFGVLNASVRPLLWFMTLPLLIVTLGLFTFVLNALMLWLTGAVSDWLGLGFQVEGFGAAFLGAVVVSVVSFMLSLFVASNKRQPQGDD